ncbi:MAG TPA: hypothetical protein VM689_20685 [Aliidongia sp.]|nr:hypothetical protein [Aliidongia sp.]
MNFNADEPRDERGRWTGGVQAVAGNWRDKTLVNNSRSGRAAALVMNALLSLPARFRRQPGWAEPEMAERLGRLIDRWDAASGLDDKAFQAVFLGNDTNPDVTHDLRTAAQGALRARTAGEMAEAADHLAAAMRMIGADRWSDFLRNMEAKARVADDGADQSTVKQTEHVLGDDPMTDVDIMGNPLSFRSQAASDVALGAGALALGAAGGGVAVFLGRAAILGLGSFSTAEIAIVSETQSILEAPEFAQLAAAHEAGDSLVVHIGGRLIQYEPNLPASGMSLFGENGFLLGPEAFASTSELKQTILHELYRLTFSRAAGGVSGELATQETHAAASFAARAAGLIR